MQVHADKDAPRRLGEFLLTIIAAMRVMQAVHIGLSQIPGGSLSIPQLRGILESGTRLPDMALFRMPGGDLFVFAEKFPPDTLRQLRALIAARVGGTDADEISGVCHIYDVPEDAVPLRRLVKSYVASASRPPQTDRAPRPTAGDGSPSPSAPSGPESTHRLEGPLDRDLLRRLQHLVDELDIAPFISHQAIWHKRDEWKIDYVEYFFDIDRLRQQYFPKLNLSADEGLFLEFCRDLDDLMLVHLLTQRPAERSRIGINLSVPTVSSSIFSKFSDHLATRERRNVICELHWLEVLQDLQKGGSAVRDLSAAGYSLAMDRIGVPVLTFLNLADSIFDFVKVRFDRKALAQIGPDSLSALRRCAPDKIVLTACDDRRSVALGEKLGVTHFQGRLLDQMVAKAA